MARESGFRARESVAIPQLCCHGLTAPRDSMHVNECASSNSTLFMDIETRISYSFCISPNIILFIFLHSYKKVTSILSLWVIQKQVADQCANLYYFNIFLVHCQQEHYPELSVLMETLCICAFQCGSYSPHMANRHLKCGYCD